MINLTRKIIPEIISGNPELKTNYIVAMVLFIVLSIIATAVTVYTYSVFLSSYPTKWIPYWMIAQSLTILVVGNLIAIYNPTNIKQYMLWLTSITTLIFTLLFLFRKESWYWYAFVEILLIKLLCNYVGIMLWSYVTTLFYRNQYKALLATFNIIFTISCIMSSAAWVATSKTLPIISILAIMIIALMVAYFFLRSSIQIVDQKTEDKNNKTVNLSNPLKYPLLQYLFGISFILTFIYYFTNFLYLKELGIHLDKREIATYTSYFLMVSNILNIFANYSLPKIFKKINFSVLLIIIFFIVILCNIIYSISSGLWGTLFLFLIISSIKDGFLNYLRDYLSSLYPPSIIIKNNFYLKSIVNSSGNILSALAAVLLFKLNNINAIIAIICTCLGVLGLILSPLIFKKYLHVLKSSVSRSSFFMLSLGKEEIKTIQNLIASELNNDNINLMQFGLITPKIFPEVPTSLYKILNSNYDEQTKLAVIKTLEQYSTEQLDTNKLLEIYKKPHLLSDKCENLICKLLINAGSGGQIQEIRNKLLQNNKLSANLLNFTLKHGYAKEYSEALKATIKLATSTDPKAKENAAIIIGSFGAGVFYDIKTKLLADYNQMVRTAMFANLPAKDIYYLLPSMSNLTKNNVSILHHKLNKEEQILISERLMRLYKSAKNKYSLTAINFITTIADTRVESYIEQLLEQQDNYARTILANKLIHRKSKLPLSKQLQRALYKAIEFEIKLIKEYTKLGKFNNIENLQNLITNRLFYARKRVISWYACMQNDHMEIINASNKLNPYEINLETSDAKDKATEYLLAKEKRLKLKKYVELALTDHRTIRKNSIKSSLKYLNKNDPWLSKIIQKYLAKGKEDMNLIQKTIALQQTNFFKSLPDEVLYEIAKACNLKDYGPDETIIAENNMGDDLYIIISGKVNVYKEGYLLSSLEPYECFGEISLLADTPITSTIISQKRTTLLAINKQDFLSITDDFPQILKNIINIVIQRFLSQVETIAHNKD